MTREDEFTVRFGRPPEVRAISPGRINLIGEHIDYLGGEVMPIAIDRHITIEAAPNRKRTCEIFPIGMGLDAPATFSLDSVAPFENADDSWLNFIAGVAAMYARSGIGVPGFQATISSTLPTGAGLSSSAALETAIALVIEQLTGVEQDVTDRALLCQQAEHEFAGVPCGVMDQMAVGAGRAGHVLKLDCRDLSIKHVPLPTGMAVLTADTGVKHALGDGEYRKRRRDCEEALTLLGADSFRDLAPEDLEGSEAVLGDRLFRRARHAVTEMERVDSFASALVANDDEEIGRAMWASHDSLRDDFEVSCPELDFLVDAATGAGREMGVVGSRMTGGGFGGSTVTLVRREEAERLQQHLEKIYREKFGRSLNCFITAAVDGAQVASLVQPPETS